MGHWVDNILWGCALGYTVQWAGGAEELGRRLPLMLERQPAVSLTDKTNKQTNKACVPQPTRLWFKGGNHRNAHRKNSCEWQAKAKALFWLQCHLPLGRVSGWGLGSGRRTELLPGWVTASVGREVLWSHFLWSLHLHSQRGLVQTWSGTQGKDQASG